MTLPGAFWSPRETPATALLFFAPGTPLGASSHSNAPAFAISFIEYRFFWKSPQSIRLLA
jgi:hypothetical protein